MKSGLSTLIYSITIILSSFVNLFIRGFPEQSTFFLTLTSILLYLSSLIILVIQKKNLEKIFQGKNIFYSGLNGINIICQTIGYSLLPISVSVPIGNLTIVFTYLFDYIINNYKFIITDYIAIPLIIIGSIIINLSKIMGNKSNKNKNGFIYLIGIISLLLSTILSGYLFNIYYDLDKEDGEIETLAISNNLLALLMTFIYPLGLYFNKIPLPKFKSSVILIFVSIFFLIIPKYIRYYLYPLINETIAIAIGSTSIIISIFLARIFLKEKLTWNKILGIGIVLLGVILASLGKEIIKTAKHH